MSRTQRKRAALGPRRRSTAARLLALGLALIALVACGRGGSCGDGSRPAGGAVATAVDVQGATDPTPVPAPATDVTDTPGPGGATPAAAPWRPSVGTTWQWQLQGALDCDDVTDGRCLPVTMFDVDLFETSTATVAALHAQAHIVICYVSVGSVEDWRPDAKAFPAPAVGKALDGWPGERWLDVRDATVRARLADRLDLARARGCDCVEPDNVDGYDNASGFPLQASDALAFVRWLVAEGHQRGLSIGLKNAPELVPQLVDDVDWALSEECVANDECAAFAPFLQAGRAIFHVEYTDGDCEPVALRDKVCADPRRAGFSTLIKEPDLGPWGRSCAAASP